MGSGELGRLRAIPATSALRVSSPSVEPEHAPSSKTTSAAPFSPGIGCWYRKSGRQNGKVHAPAVEKRSARAMTHEQRRGLARSTLAAYPAARGPSRAGVLPKCERDEPGRERTLQHNADS